MTEGCLGEMHSLVLDNITLEGKSHCSIVITFNAAFFFFVRHAGPHHSMGASKSRGLGNPLACKVVMCSWWVGTTLLTKCLGKKRNNVSALLSRHNCAHWVSQWRLSAGISSLLTLILILTSTHV